MMRFLLTSAGIKNKSIHDALVDLLGKPIADSKGVTIQVYSPTGRPQYATATADHDDE